jgi:uncharacterized protein (UPF0333 family)
MSRTLGFIGLLLALAIGAYVYSKQAKSAMGGGAEGAQASPRGTIDIAGVKNDLIAIANAERTFYATNSKYVGLDELRSSGTLNMTTNGRGPYTYSADFTDNTFRITANYSGPAGTGLPQTMSIDQTMQISRE